MRSPPIFKSKYPRILSWAAGITLLFIGYTSGLSHNPPGFYVDESAIAYNAYLVSRTGAGEFGGHCPLYFQMFTEGFTQYVSPTQVYLLALVFRFVPPSILVARTFSAFWVFAACLLLGLLAKRISGQLRIGLIVGVTALLTPWFFEVRGLVIEPHFVPFALVSSLARDSLRTDNSKLELARRCSCRGIAGAFDLLLFQWSCPWTAIRTWVALVCNHRKALSRYR